jgi:ribosomal-protein-alanine N-acetyltransferase
VTAPASGAILVTARLRLAPLAEEDVSRLHALLVHPEVRRYLMDDEIVERQWVVDLIESSRRSFADAGPGIWGIESKRDGAWVGVAGLRVSLGAREPQLIYALDPALWGQGLATEAATAVADHAFEVLGFPDLLASTDPPNRASIRVMERLGMRFLEASRAGGHPLVLYRITRAEWKRARSGAAGAAAAAHPSATGAPGNQPGR